MSAPTSPAGPGLRRAPGVGLVVALALGLVLVGGSAAHADVVSPGKLAAVHAALEAKCEACHVPFGGVPAKQCLACHTALAGRIARGLGYHPTVKAQPCKDCHHEHQGRDAALTPAPPATFDHGTTAFPLEGDHATLSCDRCHGKTGSARRWVGLATSCQSCHADRAHRGSLGSDCARCHRARGWAPTRYSLADHQTLMTGGHAPLTCVSCHRSGSHFAAPQPCALCHARPHGGTKATCETCHHVAGWKQVTFTHAFPPARLPGKHQTAPCLACHPGFRFSRTPFECAACHDQDRAHEPLGGCADCHSALAWKPSSFDHARPSVGFALTGRHQAVACAGCHPTKGTFAGAGLSCAQCHADPHRGQFGVARAPVAAGAPAVPVVTAAPAVPAIPGALAVRGAPPASRTCSDCHTTAGWKPSTITVASHAALGYPLRGAHAGAPCKSCHATGTFVGVTHVCSGCHADVRHRGRFGTDCASCHGEVAWSPATAFDHARTGFPLDRGHAWPSCKDCHGKDGLRLAKVAAPTACQTCHLTARHGKQFGARCTECHTTTSFRRLLPIDHATRTDFPLELRHATLPCLACHDARQRPVVNSACRTCHGDPHRGSNGFDCLDCHRSDRWRIIRFDHDLTAYPLVGRHRVAGCGGCHTNPNWSGVRTDCVACHAFDRPRDQDHPPEVTCDDCHTPSSWRSILRGAPGAARGRP